MRRKYTLRPSSGLQPATRTVAGFRMPSIGPPLHQHVSFRHRGAPVLRIHPSLRSDVDLLCPLSALALASVQAFTIAARRPRSRLSNPARLHRSGGRHRFRQASFSPVQARRFAATFPDSPPPAFIHARGTALTQSFLPHPSASTGSCIRPSLRSDVDLLCPLSTLSLAAGQAFTIADPDHASVVRKSNKL